MSRRTIARAVEAAGTGLFSGAAATLRIRPGPAGSGVVFVREDLAGAPRIPARADFHVPAQRRTALARDGGRVDTVEHLLAAVTALDLDDLELALGGPEVPIHDGSFLPFLNLLGSAGVVMRPGPVAWATLEAPLLVESGPSRYAITPAPRLNLRVTLEYAEPVIGTQSAEWAGDRDAFRREIGPARTFGFEREVEALGARGQLRGAAAGSGLLLSADRVLNGPARWPDEFARHKAGDLLGDLALLGARPRMRVEAHRPSHRGNIACVRAIQAAARIVEE
jgi:UDP-3-O-acyl N-acetylglucosamine deacetylase